jgi:hypothetical protein
MADAMMETIPPNGREKAIKINGSENRILLAARAMSSDSLEGKKL